MGALSKLIVRVLRLGSRQRGSSQVFPHGCDVFDSACASYPVTSIQVVISNPRPQGPPPPSTRARPLASTLSRPPSPSSQQPKGSGCPSSDTSKPPRGIGEPPKARTRTVSAGVCCAANFPLRSPPFTFRRSNSPTPFQYACLPTDDNHHVRTHAPAANGQLTTENNFRSGGHERFRPV